jgi:hypothetical protein
MAEKQIDAGLEIVAKLKMDAAGLLRDIAALERNGVRLNIRPTADASAIRAISQELDKVYQKEKMTISQLGRELGASRSTPGAGIYRPEEDVSDANRRRSVRDYYEKQNNEALLKKARSEEKAAKEADYFGKAMEFLGQGRPQRAVSTLATGALAPVLGETAGGILGGAAGLVLGGMMFKLGYQITQMFEKIPEMIMEVVGQNQAVDVMRARAAGTPAEGLGPSTVNPIVNEADEELMAALGTGGYIFHRLDENGKGREDFTKALSTTTTEFAGNITDPAERKAELEQLTKEAQEAEFGNLGAGMGNPTQTARALAALRLHRSPAAATTLLGLPGMEEFMVGQERENMKKGLSHFSPVLSDEQIWTGLKADIAKKLQTPGFRDQAAYSVMSAFENVVDNNPNVAAMKTKVDQNQAGKRFGEIYDAIFGSKEKLTTSEINALNFYQEYRQGGLNPEQAVMRYGEQHRHDEYTGGFNGPDSNIKTDRLKELTSRLENGMNPLLGGKPSPYANTPFNQPTFSFNGATELVHKMQMHAGVNIEAADITAKNTTNIAATLKSIETKLGGPQNVASNQSLVPYWQHGHHA